MKLLGISSFAQTIMNAPRLAKVTVAAAGALAFVALSRGRSASKTAELAHARAELAELLALQRPPTVADPAQLAATQQLIAAVETGNVGDALVAIRDGAAKTCEDLEKGCLLDIAIQNDDPAMAKALYQAGVQKVTNFIESPLIAALIAGKTEVAKALAEAGCDTLKTDRNGKSLLFHAATGGHITAIELCLQWNREYTQDQMNAALRIASENHHEDAVQMLLREGAVVTAS